eukprot:970601-Karenia_brevis.AAC.1
MNYYGAPESAPYEIPAMCIEKCEEWQCSKTKTDVQKKTVTFQTELHNKYQDLSTDDDEEGCNEENGTPEEAVAKLILDYSPNVPPPPSGYGRRVRKGSMKIGKMCTGNGHEMCNCAQREVPKTEEEVPPMVDSSDEEEDEVPKSARLPQSGRWRRRRKDMMILEKGGLDVCKLEQNEW